MICLVRIIILSFRPFRMQYKFDWCKNVKTKKYLPYDFVLDNYFIIIELDRLQHLNKSLIGNHQMII